MCDMDINLYEIVDQLRYLLSDFQCYEQKLFKTQSSIIDKKHQQDILIFRNNLFSILYETIMEKRYKKNKEHFI